MAWQQVFERAAVKEGAFVFHPLGRREIGVTERNGILHAVLNYCPHAGAPICEGRIENAVCSDGPGHAGRDPSLPVMRCPWHHWEFALGDGRPLCTTNGRLKIYPVKEEAGWVWIDL